MVTKIVAKFFLFVLLFISCKSSSDFVRNKEARDDANEYRMAKYEQSKIDNRVFAKIETPPILSDDVNDDTADDPAIWIHPYDPTKSIIFGSNKRKGIFSYTLDGKEHQQILCGKINNIDIRQNVKWGKKEIDILAGSNRTDRSIDIFLIGTNGQINNQADFKIQVPQIKPYGLCMYKDSNGNALVFINDKHGNIYGYSLGLDEKARFVNSHEKSFKLTTQCEGMVANDESGFLYVGEEQKGIFIFDLNVNTSVGKLIKESSNLNTNLRFDIEGLALLPPHYLMASSQGNFSYAIFDTRTEKYITSFVIADQSIDGVEETDGIEIYAGKLGDSFPAGVLIVQDGFNYDDSKKQSQNFKLVDLAQVLETIK